MEEAKPDLPEDSDESKIARDKYIHVSDSSTALAVGLYLQKAFGNCWQGRRREKLGSLPGVLEVEIGGDREGGRRNSLGC